MNKISIIIPVYNGENHVLECYNSIKNQTIKSLEIIFINDGSIDNTLDILEKIKKSDDRVIIVTQDNQGASEARNNGIRIATSEFIGFMDVDDFIHPDYYSSLLKEINKNDIIISNIFFERDNNLILKKAFFTYNQSLKKEYINNVILPRLLCIEDMTLMSCWNKLYRKDFLINNNIFFIKKLASQEDVIFNSLAFSKSESIIFIDYAGYVYKDNETSVTRNYISNNIFEKILFKYNFDYKKYVELDFSDTELKQFNSSLLMFSISFFIFKTIKLKTIKLNEKYIYINKILRNKDVIDASKNLHSMYKDSMSIFEKIILFLIKNRNNIILFFFIIILSFISSPRIVPLLRKINRFKSI